MTLLELRHQGPITVIARKGLPEIFELDQLYIEKKYRYSTQSEKRH
jgi:hypothetical protein